MDTTSQRRHGAVTAAQAAALDSAALHLGVDVEQLMEVAGFQVARLAWRMIGSRARPVHVVAGHGNNGGDALVAARYLAGWGCAITAAVVAEPERLGARLLARCDAARGAGAAVSVSPQPGPAAAPRNAVLTIDGLLGTGVSQAPRPAHAAVITGLRGAVLSVDLPSGLDPDDGGTPGAVVTAAATCALAACKRGFWAAGASRWTGAIFVADIGMPAAAWARCGLQPPSAVRGGVLRRVPPEAPAAG